MTSIILLGAGCVLLALGGALAAFAKSGQQETLGGVMICVGFLSLGFGGLLIWAGL